MYIPKPCLLTVDPTPTACIMVCAEAAVSASAKHWIFVAFMVTVKFFER